MNTLQTSNKPEVIIFSGTTILSEKLGKELEKFQCNVAFNQLTTIPNYIIYLSPSVDNHNPELKINEVAKVKEVIGLSKKYQANSVFVFPYRKYSDVNLDAIDYVEVEKTRHNDLIGILFIGDLVGRRISLSSNRLIPRILKNISEGKIIQLPNSHQDIHLIKVNEVVNQIIRRLFSFGVGESTLLFSQPIKVSTINHLLRNLNSNYEVQEITEKFELPQITRAVNTEVVNLNIEEELKRLVEHVVPKEVSVPNVSIPQTEVLRPVVVTQEITETVIPHPDIQSESLVKPEAFHFSKIQLMEVSSDPPPPLAPVPKKPKRISFKKLKFPKLKFRLNKLSLNLIVIAFIILIFPYVLLAVGAANLMLVKNQLSSGNFQSASTLNTVSSRLFNFSKVELDIYSSIPLVGVIFNGSRYMAQATLNTTNLIGRGIRSVTLASQIGEKILGKGSYEVDYLSRELSLELGSIHTDLSFLESEIDSGKGVVGYFLNRLYGDIPLNEIRQDIKYWEVIAKNLPELLGVNEKKVYLVLLQNNMELRPTGGFIGSFALASFENGKLINLDVKDVYDADGQLVGHVEPPSPIKNYLGEANWYLRDSNWDPDFPTSSQSAEWFLEKELDIVVDGVIGIDLELARGILSAQGDLYLSDFDQTVTSENLYEVTQNEVEEDFFPGSRKKSVFLTSLARELLNKLVNVESQNFNKISKVVLDNLEGRHIQIYLHEANSQKAISGLGWSGAVVIPACSGNCYVDFVSLIDANVGVNKANYYIKRSMKFDVSLDKGVITRTLTVVYENTGKEVYKTFTRVVAPNGSQFVNIEGSYEINDVRGKKEAGKLIEVNAKSNKRVIYKWTSPTSLDYKKPGRYELLFRKQAGTIDDALVVNIEKESYNTTLIRDFVTQTKW